METSQKEKKTKLEIGHPNSPIITELIQFID